MAIFLPFCCSTFSLSSWLFVLNIDVVSCPLFITKQLLKKYSVNYLLFLKLNHCFNLSKFALLHLANFSINLNVIRKLWNLGNIKVKNLPITSHQKSQQTWGLQRQFWSGRAKKSGQDKLALGTSLFCCLSCICTVLYLFWSPKKISTGKKGWCFT